MIRTALLAIFALTVLLMAAETSQFPSEPWTQADLLRPEELNARLSKATQPRPVLIEVGFPVLYRGRRIPGAQFAGPAARPEGIERLKEVLAKVPRNAEVVLYCGCCPWNQCPNMRPAFRVAKGMGFQRLKALAIPTNLAKDWIEKGYPIERGAPGK